MRFSRDELEKIVLTEVRPINGKAKLISFIAVAAEQGFRFDEPIQHDTSAAVADQIATWIETTWPNHTVRAKMAQKIARLIRNDEWRPKPEVQEELAPTTAS